MKLWARRGFEWAEEGLVGLWCPVLTGATGSTLLNCNPSTSNHGTLTNFANLNTGWIGSQYGTVLDFSGSNYVNMPLPFPQRNNWSFSIWFRCNSAASSMQSPLSMGTGTSVSNFFLVPNRSGTIQLYQSDVYRDSGIAANTNWNHCVVSRVSATEGYLTVNGVRFSANPTTTASDTMTVRIGGPSFGAGIVLNFSGQIADCCCWTKVLTTSEERLLYSAGPGGAWQLTPPSRRYATILVNAYTLIAASASYSITGQPVGLLAGRLLAADAASYLLAGNATGLNAGRLLTADSAAYALNGQDANLLAGRLLTGDTATYNLIGNAANLLASRTLQANSAQYTVTGSDAALLAGRLLDCGSSAFLLSPNQAGLLAARKLTADQSSLLLTTQATNLYAGRKITAETAQFILIASPVDLTFGGGGAAPYYYLFLLGGSR